MNGFLWLVPLTTWFCGLHAQPRTPEPDINLNWLSWRQWSSCSKSCGGGVRTRIRTCVLQAGFTGCKKTENQGCNYDPCHKGNSANPPDRRFMGQWEPWSPCTASCGGGSRERRRRCINGMCEENQGESCNNLMCEIGRSANPPNRRFIGQWEPWSPCTASCGGGSRERRRRCIIGVCEENQGESCNNLMCEISATVNPSRNDVQWSPWSRWSTCSNECKQTRQRECQRLFRWTSSQCTGQAIESRPCSNNHRCVPFRTTEPPPRPTWSSWDNWTKCSKTCGTGTQWRFRNCEGSTTGCAGDSTQERVCSARSCPPIAEWSDWSVWSSCSVTCGRGSITRKRLCEGGTDCEGDSVEESACSPRKCLPKWSQWGSWSTCSVTCGNGNWRRTRICSDGSRNCFGRGFQRARCGTRECSKEWSNWSDWSSCSVTCGKGQVRRTRSCAGGRDCDGDSFQESECLPARCPPEWSQWDSWSTCSVTCGEGQIRRTRRCVDGRDCEGDNAQERECSLTTCPPEWSKWGSWSTCTVTCGKGPVRRTRRCVNGRECEGESVQESECSLAKCPPVWSQWDSWSTCSVTCGNGNRRRERICSDGSRKCFGRAFQTEPCRKQECKKEPEWNAWEAWTECSATCGSGTRLRVRTCDDPKRKCEGLSSMTEDCEIIDCTLEAWTEWGTWTECLGSCGSTGYVVRVRSCNGGQGGAGNCRGETFEYKSCVTECPTDPKWNPWEDWTECSSTCGGGTRSRTRSCADGSKNCPGRNSDSENCNTAECKREVNWNQWSDWSRCSVSCGGGTRRRTRVCDGNGCRGSDSEVDGCEPKECPKDPTWTEWGDWSRCSVTCDQGSRSRTRICNGRGCKGATVDTEDCRAQDCPKACKNLKPPENGEIVDRSEIYEAGDSAEFKCKTGYELLGAGRVECTKSGKWSAEAPTCQAAKWAEWGRWTECTKSCGGGTQKRSRSCSGTSCSGSPSESRKCSEQKCSGRWNIWEKWSPCSKTCGGGNQQRRRTCSNRPCVGLPRESRKCGEGACPARWENWSVWSECSVSCGVGTKRRRRLCSASARFLCKGPSAENIECNERKCPPKFCEKMKAPLHGSIANVKGRLLKLGAVITFKCDEDYASRGPLKITCKKNGKWSANAPFCTARSCERNEDEIVLQGLKCNKPCSKSSDCIGVSKFCLCDGPCGKTCFDAGIMCAEPATPKNGNVDYDGLSYGYTATYNCDTGYFMNRTAIRNCQSNGEWSGYDPICTKSDSCGIAGDIGDIFKPAIQTGARIIAGSDATEGAWPWQALITLNIEYKIRDSIRAIKGGGSVINEKWILTAAHVFDDFPMNFRTKRWEFTVFLILGLTKHLDINDLPDDVHVFQPELVLKHPNFDRKKRFFDYDVAMVKVGRKFRTRGDRFIAGTLEGIIPFSAKIRSVCLPCISDVTTGVSATKNLLQNFAEDTCSTDGTLSNDTTYAVVTGYGKTRRRDILGREILGVLQQGLLKLAKNNTCFEAAKKIKVVLKSATFTPRMICTLSGQTRVQVDACQGDSGGPLVRRIVNPDGSERWVQIGIISWGLGCAYTDNSGYEYPGFFVKLNEVMDFIVQSMKDN